MSEESSQQVAVPKKELAELQAKMNLLGVNISKNSMESMAALLHRMDASDNAIANSTNLDQATLRELMDMSRQTNESVRLRLDILRAINGYATDTSNVEVDKSDEKVDTTVFSEDDAERIKSEMFKRSTGNPVDVQDAEIVK